MSQLQLFLEHLKQPEYVHVLLNTWPLCGMAAGAFFLGLSLVMRNSKEQFAALLWITLMGVVTWFAVYYGQRGYDRVYSMSNPDAQKWLDLHMKLAETFRWFFYLTGLISLTALLSKRKWQKVSFYLSGITLALSLVCAGLAGLIGQAGGQVRHSEFREGPPTPVQLSSAREDHHHHSEGQESSDEGDHHEETK